MCRKTILVVDDVPGIRAAMRVALEHTGFRVIEADNGRAALDGARQHLPDMVLLDLMMPILDGWQTVRALRQDFRTETIPVIAMTAQDGIDAVELARTGFCGHLRKPFTVAKVLAEIEHCLASGDQSVIKRACAGASCTSLRAA